jgi:hypothetical protein
MMHYTFNSLLIWNIEAKTFVRSLNYRILERDAAFSFSTIKISGPTIIKDSFQRVLECLLRLIHKNAL